VGKTKREGLTALSASLLCFAPATRAIKCTDKAKQGRKNVSLISLFLVCLWLIELWKNKTKGRI